MQHTARLHEILPMAYARDDAWAAAAIEAHGRPVTCGKGCSACCRIQPVPITPVEAFALLLLVESLAEPRRTKILERFEDASARLEQAGLARGFLVGQRPASEPEAQAEARKYLDLVLICPFLEDDCCSIYEARPFACREYFVTSPKEYCADPLGLPVETVPGFSGATEENLRAFVRQTGLEAYTIPLTLALAYCLAHREFFEKTG